MQHYNSSISQAFMVMSFAAAGLLLSVQVSGDRTVASSVVPKTTSSNQVERNPIATPLHASSSLQSIHQQDRRDRPSHTQADAPAVQKAGWSPTNNQWTWIAQPFLYPMRAINNRLTNASHGPTAQSDRTIDKIKEEMPAMPALPSRSNSVSHSVSQDLSQNPSQSSSQDLSQTSSQEKIDSTPPSSVHQQTSTVQTDTVQASTVQTNQTEHTLAEHLEENSRDRPPALASSLVVTEPQPSSSPSIQPSTHIDPTIRDSTHPSITTEAQTEQNRIQQEHPTARLVVDLSDRQLAFYQQDEEVQTYPIAVGKAGWETPLGEFTVTDKDPSPLWQHPLTRELVPAGANSPLGSRWIGFWSDGIHQIGFHGTNQSQSIGQAISHGCIRLHDADIQELYTQVALGTPVIVQP